MSDDLTRLAVLIDADNTSPKMTREMFEELAGYGTLTVKRAYGDWTNDRLRGWKAHLHKHAISPIQQFANTSGKNATDSALIIDAMDLLYAGNLDGFVIVSSDADFTRLATRLRESGKVVYGVGQRKTPKAFQDACDKFTFLEVLRDPDSEPDASPEPAAPQGNRAGGNDRSDHGRQAQADDDAAPVTRGNLQSKLTKALNKMPGDDDNWATVGALGNHLNRTDPSFDPRTYDFAKLSDLVKAQPYLETKSVQGSNGRSELWARLKGAKPASQQGSGRGDARGESKGETRGDGKGESRGDAGREGRADSRGDTRESGTAAPTSESARTSASARDDDTTSGPATETEPQQTPAPDTDAGRETQVAASEEPTVPAEDTPPAAKATTKSAAKKTAAKKATKATAKKAAAAGGAESTTAKKAAADGEPAAAKKTTRKTTRKTAKTSSEGAGVTGGAEPDAATAPAQPDEVAPAAEQPSATTTVTTRTRKRATRKAGPAED